MAANTVPLRDWLLVERGLGQIPVYRLEPCEAEFVGAMGAVAHTRFLHGTLRNAVPDPLERPEPPNSSLPHVARGRKFRRRTKVRDHNRDPLRCQDLYGPRFLQRNEQG